MTAEPMVGNRFNLVKLRSAVATIVTMKKIPSSVSKRETLWLNPRKEAEANGRKRDINAITHPAQMTKFPILNVRFLLTRGMAAFGTAAFGTAAFGMAAFEW